MLATGALYLARNESWGHVYLALLLPAILALNVAYTGFTGLVSDMVGSEQVSLFTCARALSGSRVEGLGFSRCSLRTDVLACVFFRHASTAPGRHRKQLAQAFRL